jgi:HEPN domain-containing protein
MAELPDLQKLQSEWYEYGEEDRINAKLIFNARGAVSGVGLHLQQSVEKYLKGYLIGRGWELIKTHDLELLIDTATGYDERFSKFLGFGRKVSTFYVKDRYPPKPKLDFTVEEMKSLIKTGDRLIGLIKEDEGK